MRHRYSRIALIESRLSSPQSSREFALRQQAILPGSVSELSQKMPHFTTGSPSSGSELSMKDETILPSSDSELSDETRGYDRVRNPNRYVRSFTQGVKDTYVGGGVKSEPRLRWPSVLVDNLATADRDNVEPQLRALPGQLGQQVLDDVAERVSTGEIKNVIAYLLATLKRARNGQFNTAISSNKRVQQPQSVQSSKPIELAQSAIPQSRQRASVEQIAQVMEQIRASYKR